MSLALASIAIFMSGYALWISVPLHRQQPPSAPDPRNPYGDEEAEMDATNVV